MYPATMLVSPPPTGYSAMPMTSATPVTAAVPPPTVPPPTFMAPDPASTLQHTNSALAPMPGYAPLFAGPQHAAPPPPSDPYHPQPTDPYGRPYPAPPATGAPPDAYEPPANSPRGYSANPPPSFGAGGYPAQYPSSPGKSKGLNSGSMGKSRPYKGGPAYDAGAGSASHAGGVLPTPTGRKLALITGVDPESSDAASRGCYQMEAFLKRHGYMINTVQFSGNDWTGYRSRVEHGISELISSARPGDTCLFYCIGYDCTAQLRELVDRLPRGVRLTCVFDCCYVSEKPAFRIHYSTPSPTRTAQPMGPITDYPKADVFLFEGLADIRCVAWFKSANGNTPLFTAAFIRALSRGPEGYWGTPSTTSYIGLTQDIEHEIGSIVKRLPAGALPDMTSSISCTQPYNVDQPFIL